MPTVVLEKVLQHFIWQQVVTDTSVHKSTRVRRLNMYVWEWQASGLQDCFYTRERCEVTVVGTLIVKMQMSQVLEEMRHECIL